MPGTEDKRKDHGATGVPAQRPWPPDATSMKSAMALTGSRRAAGPVGKMPNGDPPSLVLWGVADGEERQT
jgi:hypothetical protein